MHNLRDVALAQHVQELLVHYQRLSSFPFHVTAHEGTVYLSGRVDNEEYRREAENLVRGAAGVRRVVNQLESHLGMG